jgi:hypothetical protein
MSAKDSPEQLRLRSDEEFNEWMDHPVTRKLFHMMAARIQDKKDAWADGAFVASLLHEQFVREATAKGYISAFVEILNLEAKDLEDNE